MIVRSGRWANTSKYLLVVSVYSCIICGVKGAIGFGWTEIDRLPVLLERCDWLLRLADSIATQNRIVRATFESL